MVNTSLTDIPNVETAHFVLFPPLESGDRLSRNEFERRYAADPHIKKAELIEGIVYVASPLRFESHAEPHTWLITWLSIYQISTSGVRLGIEPTVRLDQDNEPQPDGVLLIDEVAGGKSRLSADDYIEGSPEMVVEIAASSAAKDLHDKKKAYQRNSIQEYIVWSIFENKLDWFCLEDGEYVLLAADATGVLKSKVFPGLWLSLPHLLTGDMAEVLNVLQAGLKTAEHIEFVKYLSDQSQRH